MLKDILKHGTILTLGNAASGLLNYAFIVLAARGLGPEIFGSLGVLLTFFYVAGALVPGIQTLVAQNVVEGQAKRADSAITRLIRSSGVTIGTYSLVAFIVYAAFSPLIDASLRIGNLPAVLIVPVVCVIRALSGVPRGSLQGLQRFPVLAGVRTGEACVRFALGLVLVAIGFSLVRTVSVYLLSAVVLLVGPMPFLPIKWRDFWRKGPRLGQTTITGRAYLIGAAFCLLAALTQIDMVAAKYYLTADIAGHYAAATNLVKAPFLLLGGSFATVMFPSVVRGGAKSGASVKLLTQTLAPVAIVLGLAISACYVAPGQIVSMLVGAEYEHLARWLALFAAGACAPPLLYVVARYHMVSHGPLLLVSLAFGLTGAIASLVVFHTTQYHMIAAMLVGSGLPLIVLIVHAAILAVNSRSRRKSSDEGR